MNALDTANLAQSIFSRITSASDVQLQDTKFNVIVVKMANRSIAMAEIFAETVNAREATSGA
jgi:hypothetical protein